MLLPSRTVLTVLICIQIISTLTPFVFMLSVGLDDYYDNRIRIMVMVFSQLILIAISSQFVNLLRRPHPYSILKKVVLPLQSVALASGIITIIVYSLLYHYHSNYNSKTYKGVAIITYVILPIVNLIVLSICMYFFDLLGSASLCVCDASHRCQTGTLAAPRVATNNSPMF